MTDSIRMSEQDLVLRGRAMDFPGIGCWAALVIVCAINTIWLLTSERLSVDPSSVRMVLLVVGLTGFFVFYCRSRTDLRLQRLSVPLIGTLFIVLAFTALRVLNHLTMSIPFPWVDDSLADLDAMLGLSWLNYAEWVAAHPPIVSAFGFAYTGLTLVALAVFITLCAVGRNDRAKEFVRLVFVTGLAATVIGSLFPARGAMDRLALSYMQETFGPSAGVYYVPYLQALRSNLPHVLNLQELPGLAAIPSFHTACALLIVYSCRGIRILQLLAILYSAVMIASTPIMGGHYFVDLIAGGILVAAVLFADRRLRSPATATVHQVARPANELTTQVR